MTEQSSQEESQEDSQGKSKDCSKVYEELVTNEDDIVGFIAYSLYKRRKRRYINNFENEKNRKPTSEEILTHVNCVEMHDLEAHRSDAKKILEELLEQAVSDKEAELGEKFQKKQWEYIKNYSPPDRFKQFGSFLLSSTSGLVGNIFTTALFIIIYFSLSSQTSQDGLKYNAAENFIYKLSNFLGVETIEVEPSAPELENPEN